MRTTITTLSTWTGIHRDTIRKRLASILTGQHAEQVDSTKALPLIYGDGVRLDAAQEKAALDKVRRGLATLEFKKRQGELIEVQELMKVIDTCATACREHLLGLPSRFADIFASESDARAIEETMEAEIRAALHRVADSAERFTQ